MSNFEERVTFFSSPFEAYQDRKRIILCAFCVCVCVCATYFAIGIFEVSLLHFQVEFRKSLCVCVCVCVGRFQIASKMLFYQHLSLTSCFSFFVVNDNNIIRN